MACKKETASSAASWATFKENIPTKINVGDVWMNKKKKAPKQGRQLEAASEPGGTLIGRLAMRMSSRDIIDRVHLGPKETPGEAKKARIADMSEVADSIPSKMMLGAGLHLQTKDKKAMNFSNPIPEGQKAPGSNMTDQAKFAGNVYNSPFDRLGKNIVDTKKISDDRNKIINEKTKT